MEQLVLALVIAAGPSEVWLRTPFSGQNSPASQVRDLDVQSTSEAYEFLKNENRALLMVGSDACSASMVAEPVFNQLARQYSHLVTFARVNPRTYKVRPGETTPTFIYYEAGVMRDRNEGFWYPDGWGIRQIRMKQILEGMVIRNIYGFNAARDFLFRVDVAKHGTRKEDLILNAYAPGLDRSGRDLRGFLASGSFLRDASFRDSDLTGAEFYNCDLKGADFAGATLDAVSWAGSTCPDGHRVEERQDSCLKHLKIAVPPRSVGVRPNTVGPAGAVRESAKSPK